MLEMLMGIITWKWRKATETAEIFLLQNKIP